MTAWVIVLLAAFAMEPFAVIAHRTLMHGRVVHWHRSHHSSSRGDQLLGAEGFEANDLFPVVFAGITIAVMALGAYRDSLRPLLWIGAGEAAYGFAYLLVHDVCIHGRLGKPFTRGRYLSWVREAHGIHHRYGRAPFGFLLPVVPRSLRRLELDESVARPVGGRS